LADKLSEQARLRLRNASGGVGLALCISHGVNSPRIRDQQEVSKAFAKTASTKEDWVGRAGARQASGNGRTRAREAGKREKRKRRENRKEGKEEVEKEKKVENLNLKNNCCKILTIII